MSDALKTVVTRVAGGAVAWPAVFSGVTGALTIFNYHEVTDSPSAFTREHDLNVTPARFSRQLEWIARHYEVIDVPALLAGRVPSQAAMVTFDDGFASTFEEALPRLHAHHMPSAVFVNGAVVQGDMLWASLVAWLYTRNQRFREMVDARRSGRPLPPQVLLHPSEVDPYLTEAPQASLVEEVNAYTGRFGTPALLRGAADLGATLGNHLDNHYNAASLRPDELHSAYQRNESWLRHFAGYRPVFSYPFGQPGTCYTPQTHDVLRRAGAARVFGAWALPNPDPSAFVLHRCTLTDRVNSMADFRFEAAVRPRLNQFRGRQSTSGAT